MPDEGFTELAGERVVLRRLGLADLAEFVAYRSSAQVARFPGSGSSSRSCCARLGS